MTAEIDNFASIATEYCTWAENTSLQEDEIIRAVSLIATLYTGALALPNDGCGEEIVGKEVTHEEWKLIYKHFGALPFNYYTASFSPSDLGLEPGTGNLADDLTDIYRDIKDGLSLYENGHEIEAVWHWKQNFNTHWARHAVGALHAMQCYLSDEYIFL